MYDYKCERCSAKGLHPYFTQKNAMVDHAKGVCPTCGSDAKQVILTAPAPLVEAMADAGCPGAFHTSGDRLTKRHRKAGQYHNPSNDVAAEAKAIDQELQYASKTTSPTP
jgi:hypothetical protein